jgi:prepilin-type N-terminal cleavage/methylation domain-containing protein
MAGARDFPLVGGMRTHLSPPSDSRSSGFSLMELLVVLMLIGIGLSIAAPSFNRMVRSFRGDSVGALLSNDLALARLSAVRHGRPASLVIASPTEYRVEVQTAPVRLIKTVRLKSDYPGLSIAGESAAVTFDSRGFLAPGSNAKIKISGGATADSVTVTPVGRVYRGE